MVYKTYFQMIQKEKYVCIHRVICIYRYAYIDAYDCAI